MQRALLIAEKPSLMRTIKETYQNIQGLGYTIHFTAQAGHLMRLLLPSELDEEQQTWCWENLPFFPEEHGGWKYRVIEGKQKLLNDIKKEIHSGNYDFIIHAGDPDQEGQLLVQLVLNECKNTLPVKRFWSNDLTPKAIEKALKHLRDNDSDPFLQNLYQAAQMRQKTDYLFGMNFSRAISLKTNQKMSIGRVKTPTTKIIVDRENEIANFKPTTTYEASVTFKEGYTGVLQDAGGNIAYPTKEIARGVLEALNNTGTITYIEKTTETTKPPAYFKLSTLQIAAGKAFGYNADKVLALVQGLYEKKMMSYPRTSCEFLSSATDFRSLLRSAAAIPELEPYVSNITDADIQAIQNNKRYCNDKKLQEAGHTALTLTEIAPEGLTTDERNIYVMVAKQLIASFLPPLVEDKTVVLTQIDDHIFKSNGKVLISKGFTELLEKKSEDKALPPLAEGQVVTVESKEVNEKTTTCPKRFTDADVIAIMENPSKYLNDKTLKDKLKGKLKIGTEATRASEIADICGRTGYAEKKKGKGKAEYIYALPKSIGLIARINTLDVSTVDMTAKLEGKLDSIRAGELTVEEYYEDVRQYVEDQIKLIKASTVISLQDNVKISVGKCKCGGDMVVGQKSVFCSNWKKNGCKSGFPKNLLGATLLDSDIKKLFEGKIIVKTLKKDDKTWKQRLKLDENCKLEFVKNVDMLPDVTCPICGSGIKETEKYFMCEDYKNPDCTFIIGKSFFGAKISQADILKLLEGKRIKKKMVSKAGKDYEAYLSLKDGKIQRGFD